MILLKKILILSPPLFYYLSLIFGVGDLRKGVYVCTCHKEMGRWMLVAVTSQPIESQRQSASVMYLAWGEERSSEALFCDANGFPGPIVTVNSRSKLLHYIPGKCVSNTAHARSDTGACLTYKHVGWYVCMFHVCMHHIRMQVGRMYVFCLMLEEGRRF